MSFVSALYFHMPGGQVLFATSRQNESLSLSIGVLHHVVSSMAHERDREYAEHPALAILDAAGDGFGITPLLRSARATVLKQRSGEAGRARLGPLVSQHSCLLYMVT